MVGRLKSGPADCATVKPETMATKTNPKVLIVYASNSGNTKLVAERIGERLAEHGFSGEVRDVARMRPADLRDHDVIIFGSCTWERTVDGQKLEAQLPEHMHRFAESTEHVKLPDAKFAIFALGRHEYTGFAGAANHLQVLVRKLGGALLTKPLKIDGFPHDQLETVDTWTDGLAAVIKQPAPPITS